MSEFIKIIALGFAIKYMRFYPLDIFEKRFILIEIIYGANYEYL